MVAKRIELRSGKGLGDEPDASFSAKDFNFKGKNVSIALYWIIGIMVILGMYHCHTSYLEQLES